MDLAKNFSNGSKKLLLGSLSDLLGRKICLMGCRLFFGLKSGNSLLFYALILQLSNKHNN